MKRFSFRLDRVLRLRRHAEHDWELKLGAATAECLAIQHQLEQTVSGIAAGAALGYRGLDTSQMINREMYRRRLEQQIQELSTVLAVREAHRDQVKQGYLEAQRERKVVDKLRERQEQEHYREQLRLEEEAASDMALTRFSGKRSRGEGVDGDL